MRVRNLTDAKIASQKTGIDITLILKAFNIKANTISLLPEEERVLLKQAQKAVYSKERRHFYGEAKKPKKEILKIIFRKARDNNAR